MNAAASSPVSPLMRSRIVGLRRTALPKSAAAFSVFFLPALALEFKKERAKYYLKRTKKVLLYGFMLSP